jgi:hypothetical protein
MTLTDYAKRRGVSKMAVSLAVKHGRLVKCIARDAHGRPCITDPELADREWLGNSDYTNAPQHDPGRKAPEPAASSAPPEESLAGSAAREKHWKAKIAEIEFLDRSGELVSAKEVEREWTDLLSHVRTRLLAIPTYVKQSAPHLSTSDVAVVDQHIRDALAELSK